MSTTTTNRGHRKAARRFNRRVLNPLMLLLAGRRHVDVAVLHHTGRRSGKAYRTPVVAEPIDGGFVVPLPYGADVDWLLNVRAAERATIELHSRTYVIGQPQVIDAAQALPMVSPSRQRAWGRLDTEHYLRVRTEGSRP